MESKLEAKRLLSRWRKAMVVLLRMDPWQKASDSRMKLGGFV
jgi:hypothetical protein